jgi:hypothetical protein
MREAGGDPAIVDFGATSLFIGPEKEDIGL